MILRFECYGAIALAIATGFAAAGPTGDGSLKPRILGGTTTNKSDYPFIVYLHNAAEKTFCGGSIISADWILTAAHCIKTAKASDIAVYIGQADYNPDPSKASSVSSITTHPGYDDSTMVNDLSLLKLSSPITSSGNSSTISIDSTSVGDGVTVTALGWGYTSPTGSSASTQLKKGDLKTLSKAECSPKDSKFTGNNGATICVAADTGTDTCPGDSGGPLIRQVDGKNVLVGITSFGTAGSGQSITVNCGGNGMVSLFTHAYYYESFINSTTGGLREIQGAHISGGDTSDSTDLSLSNSDDNNNNQNNIESKPSGDTNTGDILGSELDMFSTKSVSSSNSTGNAVRPSTLATATCVAAAAVLTIFGL